MYSLLSHFCSHSSARMPDLVSEVDSDRRAARGSWAWPLPGSGARSRASASGESAQPAARRIMSHGRVTIFGALTGSQPARIQHRIHASIGKFHACSHACMTGCLPGWLQKLFQWPCDMMRRAAGCARPPNPEARARAPEPGKGQARLARAARRSESTSETRSGMRALE